MTPAVRLVDIDLRLYDGAAGDGIADPGETLWPRLTLAHIGTEVATDLRATLLSLDDEIIVVRPDARLATLAPGATWEIVNLRLQVTSDAVPFQASAVIDITADNGGPWRFTIPLPISNVSGMQVRTAWVLDPEPGGDGDRGINPGESITVNVRVANDGLGVHTNVQTTLVVDDSDIVVTSAVDPVESWSPQSSHNRTVSFTADVASDAQPHDVDVVVEITADDSDPHLYTLVIPIINRPPDFERRSVWVWDRSTSGNGDGAANPGERVYPRIRLRNIGQSPATNVRASLVILDPDVEVVSGLVTHDTWPAGEGRSNNGFVLDIATDATSHAVEAVLSVTADDVGPWRFAVTIPVVAPEAVATTALLANYPNPFNPETWIPFDLSEAAEVTVSVYDPRGVVVRRLDLGSLGPGRYRGRSTAAYWDGRNDFGEQVSSGVYMYELRAGPSRQMRRMIVRK
ncbi:hypothetical protein HOI71_12285 [Candidatus Poribacteria bacterium]|nr:hypothetical protein [Candidatus Poribacteria bacterium]